MNIPLDVYNWLKTANTQNNKQLGLDLVKEEYEELVEAVSLGDKEAITDAVVDLIWVAVNNLVFNDITLEEFEEYANKVGFSNWSKFCAIQSLAEDTVKAYQTGTHWDKFGKKIECYWECNNGIYVVKRHDGKILKSLWYTKANQV